MMVTARPANEPSQERTIARDTVIAALIVALAVAAGATALWTGRHNTTMKKSPPTTFPISSTLVAVPDAVGRNVYLVVGDLRTAHLNFALVSTSSKTAPSGAVISQSPAAGTQVHGGTVVRLTISKGPQTGSELPPFERTG
jgi:beta-lactam-binding protein with PASTA domain